MKISRCELHCVVVVILAFVLFCGIAISQTLHPSYGILRSTDNGKTWTHIFRNDLDIDHLVIDKNGHILAETMIATAKEMRFELYASSLGSEGWKKIALLGADPKGEPIEDMLATPDGSIFILLKDRILKTNDGGSTWTVVTSTLPRGFRALKLGPDQSLLGLAEDVMFQSNGGLFQSTDNGKTWHSLGFADKRLDGAVTLLDGRILVSFRCKLFAVSARQEISSEWSIPEDGCPNVDQFTTGVRGLLFDSTSHGILKTDVAVKNWKKVLANDKEVDPMQISITPDGDLFAVILEGIDNPTLFRSSDAGETWQAIRKLGYGVTVSQFAFAPGGIVYAGLTSFGD